MTRQVKIVKQKIHGLAEWNKNSATITIDPDLSPKQEFLALFEEDCHIVFDNDSEDQAGKWEELALLLWKQGCRIVKR